MKTSLAVMITAISISSIAAIAFTTADLSNDNQLQSTAALLGHISLVAYDENGNIKNYVQTDNVILDEGDDCIIEDLFGASGGCFATHGVADPFDDIVIGTGTVTFTEGSAYSQVTYDSVTAATVGSLTAASAGGATFSLLSLVSSQVLRSASVVRVVDAGAVDDIIVVLPSVNERRCRRNTTVQRVVLFLCTLASWRFTLCIDYYFVLSFELFAAF